MAFQPRQYLQILEDMINYVRLNRPDITDYNVGSAIRTILEAASREDDEQYFQMVQLLDAFNIFSASGTDLDARVADADLTRLQPAASTGRIKIQDENLIKSTLRFDALTTATTIELEDSTKFPTVGFPYTVRIGEETVEVEDVSVSANNTTTNTLSVSVLTKDHDIGDRVAFVSGVADLTLAANIQVQTPAVGTEAPIVFVSIEQGTIVNGNYRSTPIKAKAVVPGKSGNIGAGRISEFSSSPPFTGASVTNITSFSSGRNTETDAELRDRYLLKLQSLSAGTPLALKEGVLGITDPSTGQRVVTSNVFEDFVNDEVIVYVDDGTGFVPDQVLLPRDSLDASSIVGASSLSAVDASEFPGEGFILVSPENSAQIELIEYSSVNYTTNDFTLATNAVNAHDSGDEVLLVEVVTLSSDPGQTYFTLNNYPVVRNSERIWVDTGGGLVLQAEDVDYLINRGRSQFELLNALPAGAVVVVSYSYYTGLIFQAQRVINGDPEDETNFPGVAAGGIITVVETPTIRRITVKATITVRAGFNEETVALLVKESIENYISSLGIGEDVILAEIIERGMNVAGMTNMSVQLPSSDVSVLFNELPVPFNAAGESLVTVN